MKQLTRLALLMLALMVHAVLPAQTDSIRLVCPLNDAEVVPPPKNAIHYDPPDLCVVLTSKPDTIVKSVSNARVTNVETDEEGKQGVVLFARLKGKDYYFWYTGMTKVIVTKNTMLTAGQPIGYISPGDKIEMLMYQFETPLDPSKYLDCKTVLRPF